MTSGTRAQTLLYELSVPIEHIQDVLRHPTPVITKTLYVDGTGKVQRDAADKLDDLLAEDEDGWTLGYGVGVRRAIGLAGRPPRTFTYGENVQIRRWFPAWSRRGDSNP